MAIVITATGILAATALASAGLEIKNKIQEKQLARINKEFKDGMITLQEVIEQASKVLNANREQQEKLREVLFLASRSTREKVNIALKDLGDKQKTAEEDMERAQNAQKELEKQNG